MGNGIIKKVWEKLNFFLYVCSFFINKWWKERVIFEPLCCVLTDLNHYGHWQIVSLFKESRKNSTVSY